MIIVAFAFVAIGVLYIWKPDLFRRWFWTRTSIAQRALSPEAYLKYMRGVGVVHILIGLALLFWSLSPH